MGRPERVVSAQAGVVAEFALALRALRREAGNPSYRKMSVATHYSAATLARAASGNSLPTLALTLAYAEACGGVREDWERRWLRVRALSETSTPADELELQPDLSDAPRVLGQALAADDPGVLPATTRWHVSKGVRAAAAITALVAGAVIATLALDGHHTIANATGPQSPVSRYDQTVGPGCPHTAQARVTQDDFTSTHKWTQATTTTWTVAGCSNLILYSEPTASSNPDRWQDDYEWYFDNVPKSMQCTFRIYIPASPYSRYTAAYDWTTGDSNYLESTAFVIDQSAYAGQWYDQGPYIFPTGQAMMMITDARSGIPDATLTAAAVRLTCK